MREIKFRAWDFDKKRFFYVQIHPNQIGWSSMLWTKSHGQYSNDTLKGVFFESSDGKWQQFTGLHDKNGKEIWEGDILTSPLGATFGFVDFKEGSFILQQGQDVNGLNKFDCSAQLFHS